MPRTLTRHRRTGNPPPGSSPPVAVPAEPAPAMLPGNQWLPMSLRRQTAPASTVRSLASVAGNQAVQRIIGSGRDTAQPQTSLGNRIRDARHRGTPLEAGLHGRLESSLGTKLPRLTIHHDQESDTLAKAADSLAFTSETDVFFRSGAYRPHTPDGFRVLAHEAFHTAQQASGPVAGTATDQGVSLSHPSDAFEQAAEQAASRAVHRAGRTGPAAPAGPVSAARPRAGATAVQRLRGGGAPAPADEQQVQYHGFDRPAVQQEPVPDEHHEVQFHGFDGAAAEAEPAPEAAPAAEDQQRVLFHGFDQAAEPEPAPDEHHDVRFHGFDAPAAEEAEQVRFHGDAPANAAQPQPYLGKPGEQRDLRLMQSDPRMAKKYELDREVDSAKGMRWAGLKAKNAAKSAAHSLNPMNWTKQDVSSTAIGLIPIAGTVAKAKSAYNEHGREKADLEVTKAAEASDLTKGLGAGRAAAHNSEKWKKGVGATFGLVGDAVTVGTFGAGAALGPAVNAMASPLTGGGGSALSQAVSGNVAGAAATTAVNRTAPSAIMTTGESVGYKGGQLLHGAIKGQEGATRRQAVIPNGAPQQPRDVDRANEALMKLTVNDPDYSKALLEHLTPPEMSVGQELALNRSLQSTVQKRRFRSDIVTPPETLKPSEVAAMAQKEKARLAQRERMGASPTWSPQADKAAMSEKSIEAAPAANVPQAPPLAAAAANGAGRPQYATELAGMPQQNFLKKLAKQEDRSFYE